MYLCLCNFFIKMFYSHKFSMNSKTDVALIYYVSTINKRINKNLIQRLNINEALNNIIEQPYAMRLYSYLLKGIVRIYLLKYKYYQNEVNALLNVLKFKDTLIIKNKKIEDAGYIIGINNLNDNNESNQNNKKIITNSFSNNLSELYTSNNDNIFDNDPSFIYDTNFTNELTFIPNIKDLKINRRKRFIDTEIECSNSTRNICKIKHFKLQNIHIKMYPIFNMIKNSNQEYFDDIESMEYIRNISSNIVHTSTMQTSTVNTSSNVIPQHINSSHCNYSYCVSIDTRYEQAKEFYELLVKLSNGEIKAYQMMPYDKIEIY